MEDQISNFHVRFSTIRKSTIECLLKSPQIDVAFVIVLVASIIGIRVQESIVQSILKFYKISIFKIFCISGSLMELLLI